MALAPLPKGVKAYKELTDAPNLEPGTTEIWFAKTEFFFKALRDLSGLKRRGLLPTLETLEETHAKLGEVDLTLENVFMNMQGHIWSPWGEARYIIRSAGTSHTSMSVGDVIVVDGVAHIVDILGFIEL